MDKKTTILLILDGLGISERDEGNAVKAANMEVLNQIISDYPHQYGYTSGLDVGLPQGQMGNSEVGHLNIGAGRIVYQEFTRISKSISDKSFFSNKALLQSIENCKKHDSALHLMGLLSDGGVHSHIEHLYALLSLAKENNLKKVYVHAFMDGRDTMPNSGEKFILELEEYMRNISLGEIASISGRYYAMDRDMRWERTFLAFNAICNGIGEKTQSAELCIQKSYENEITDEFVLPAVIFNNDKPVAKIEKNDSIINFNFRPDRARQITRAFCEENFDKFDKKIDFYPNYTSFTQYDIGFLNVSVAFKPVKINNVLGEYLSGLGLKQLRLAETEKYAHVTFFFNAGVEKPYPGEDRILIPSPKVATYDLLPKMSSDELTIELVKAIKSHKYNLIVVNYANPDMLGHTGKFEVAVEALKHIDKKLAEIRDVVLEEDAQMFICADHGNIEQMIDYESKKPYTAHTTNPVNFILFNYKKGIGLKKGGRLADIAATLLEMMGLEAAKEMEGNSLLVDI